MLGVNVPFAEYVTHDDRVESSERMDDAAIIKAVAMANFHQYCILLDLHVFYLIVIKQTSNYLNYIYLLYSNSNFPDGTHW